MAKKKKKAKQAPTFEARLARLEQIVEELESGEVGLDASLNLYAEGAELIQVCRKDLAAAEERIQKLTETAEGDLETEAMEADEEGQQPDEDA